jgi:cell division transport system permease protein
MKRYETGYLIREGIRGIFLNAFMSFAAITVIAACLVIMGSFGLVAHNVNQMVTSMEQTNILLAYVDDTYTEIQARSVGTRINMLDNIERSDFVSKDQALENFIENAGAFAEGLREGDNPFRHRFVITMRSISLQNETVRLLQGINGIAEVRGSEQMNEIITSLHTAVNLISFSLILMLSVVSIFIVANTIKLATYDRREEIAIMRVVGATRRFIRFPFFIEGAIIGVMGGIVAYIAQWGIYGLLAGGIAGAGIFIPFTEFSDLQLRVIVLFLFGGLTAGVLGSTLTIRRFLKV